MARNYFNRPSKRKTFPGTNIQPRQSKANMKRSKRIDYSRIFPANPDNVIASLYEQSRKAKIKKKP